MKRIFLIILFAVCTILASSCAGYTASTPGEPFSREDWDVCGFEPWAGRDELQEKLNAEDGVCGDSNESWSEGLPFNGGSVNISCHWLLEWERLYTVYNWTVTVTNMSAGVALPRGLYIGSSMEQVKKEFGLGEEDEQGIYYGDGENAPYAIIKDIDYYNYKKEITLAVPAGETNDERYNYTCILKLMFDGKDSLAEFSYITLLKYRVLSGLPEPEQVNEVRLYSIGKEQPERVLKFEDAIDVLGSIQNAGQYPSKIAFNPTHRIEIVSGGDIYTLIYGDKFIEAPDGRAYEISRQDEDALFDSLPELCPYKGTYIREWQYDTAALLSEEQQEEIKRIIGNMVPCSEKASGMFSCSEEASGSGQCWINVDSGDGYDSCIYLFGSSHLIFEGNGYHVSEQDSLTIQRIYHEVFRNIKPRNAGPAEGDTAPVLSGEPLLPGLPSPNQIEEVRIWNIGNEGIKVVFTPFEAAELYEAIQAGGGKPLEGKLESPTHKILLIRDNSRYELTVGSNGIKAWDGKVYSVVFTEKAARVYLRKSIWSPDYPNNLPSNQGFIEGFYHSNSVIKELSEEQLSDVSHAVSEMTPCTYAIPQGDFCAFSLFDDENFSYRYYFGTNYIVYEEPEIAKEALFTISGEHAERLIQICYEEFGDRITGLDHIPAPRPSSEVSSTPSTEESPAPVLSGESLLPGMPTPSEITDVLVWRIGEQGITYKWKPSEAEELFGIIQAGKDKPLGDELESPKYIILIRGGNRGYNYEITVGSNGIKALNGEGYRVVYDVVFPDNAAEKYLPESAWDPEDLYTVPPKGGFTEGCIHDPYNLVKNLKNVKDFTDEQFSAVSSAVDNMKPCADANPSGKFFGFSLALETEKNTEQWFTYEYYIGTNYVSYEVQGLVKKSLFKISEKDARALTQVYKEIYTKCFSELLFLPAEPLLPGLPRVKDITEVRTWRIGEEGQILIIKASEAQDIFTTIQAGSDKPLKGKLESPTHIIQIRSGSKRYELTVGSNGIKTPKGKLYEVIFPKDAPYLLQSIWNPNDPYIVPPAGRFDKGSFRGTNGIVKELSAEQIEAVGSAVDDMTPCNDANPRGHFFAFSLFRGEYFAYEYYFGTNYIRYEVQGRVKKSLFTISDEDAQTLTKIYNDMFK